MSASTRKFLCWMMLVLVPSLLSAADAGSPAAPGAVVHSQGGVWVNGAETADSTAIFPGDTLETKPGFVATLDAAGSSVLLQPESIVRFQGTFVALEHGSVSVETSTSLSVHINCIKVEPMSARRTQYDVTDVSGTALVAAHKGDVNIVQTGTLRKPSSAGAAPQSATVHEGQQTTRDESVLCGPPSTPESVAHSLNTKWIEIGGGAAGGVVALCLLLCKGTSSGSVSPSAP